VENGDEGCLDLCRLLRETVDDAGCRNKDDGYQVVLVKRGHGTGTTG
jgi:hypothetical protein